MLTNLGLSQLPGSRPGGACYDAAVARLLSDLQANAAACGFWGNSLRVEARKAGQTAGGFHAATMQGLGLQGLHR